MKIRVMGTPAECATAVEVIREATGLTVLEVSPPQRNRGASTMVRVYLEVREDSPAAGAGR